MTHIANPMRYKSKKAFREAVALDPSRVYLDDPSLFNPVSGSVEDIVKVLGSFAVTNHPKRSWFAAVNLKNGKVVVS